MLLMMIGDTHTIRRTVSGLFLGLLVTGLSCNKIPTSPVATEEERIQEAAFRYQIQSYLSSTTFKVIFVATAVTDSTHHVTSQGDPPSELVKRLDTYDIPVKTFSECRVDGLVYDRGTGSQGVLYRVAGIEWTSPTSVEADGGNYIGPRGIDMFRFYLSKSNGTWAVDSTEWLFSS